MPIPRITETLRPDASGLARAAALVRAGDLVAFPTETVYGLGGDATDDLAVARIFAAKDRPRFNPLIAHVADVAAAQRLVVWSDLADRLAAAFWPGPMTLVLPLRADAGVSALVTADLPTLAVRVPAHPAALALLDAVGRPIAAPSANPSGRISPTSAAHVLAGLSGRIAAVLDGGPCAVGLESTILGLTPDLVLLRAGGVPSEALANVLGYSLTLHQGSAITAPGQLASHYAPDARVRLDALTPHAGEVMLGFGPVPGTLTLSATGDLTEAAAHLFRHLHALDAMSPQGIAVAPIPETGLGRAINDRLRRAAAPRN